MLDGSYAHVAPMPDEDAGSDEASIWSYRHDASSLASVLDVSCRVRDMAFAQQRVLERLDWGFEDDAGAWHSALQLTAHNGDRPMLPLTEEFLYKKLVTFGGRLAEDESDLHPLPTVVDAGLVLVFAYWVGMHLTRPIRRRP